MKGFIYKIVNTKTTDIYIGSTIQEIKNRFKTHKSNARVGKTEKLYEFMREHGIENFSIELIEECVISHKKDLLEREKYYYKEIQPSLNMISPKTIIEKEKGKIYKINFLDDEKIYYIGSTTSDISLRLIQHKSASINGKTPLYIFMREMGKENFEIECLEDGIPVEQLIIRENHWISELNPTLNKNKNLCLTEKERDRIKYLNNREKRLKQVSDRRLLKRDEINAQKREHYHLNKERIAQKDKQKRQELRTKEIVYYEENPEFDKEKLAKYTVFELKEIAKKMKLNSSPRLKEKIIQKILDQQEHLFKNFLSQVEPSSYQQ